MAGTITLTEKAAKRIARIMDKEPDKTALRISVEGGGCAGFSYKFGLVAGENEDDTIITRDGAKVNIQLDTGSECVRWLYVPIVFRRNVGTHIADSVSPSRRPSSRILA